MDRDLRDVVDRWRTTVDSSTLYAFTTGEAHDRFLAENPHARSRRHAGGREGYREKIELILEVESRLGKPVSIRFVDDTSVEEVPSRMVVQALERLSQESRKMAPGYRLDDDTALRAS